MASNAPPAIAETTITYQGQLQDGEGPFDGTVAMSFTLHEHETNNLPIGPTLSLPQVSVSDGLFTVDLDFGEVFTGQPQWLEVRVDGTPLTSRQQITAVPLALNVPPGAGSNWQRENDDIHYNSGRVGIGVEDPAAVLQVAGSVVSGHEENTASGGNSFVSGGRSSGGAARTNIASGPASFIGGGSGNASSSFDTFIGGGRDNIAEFYYSIVVGGRGNAASGQSSAIACGEENSITGDSAVVAGGMHNSANTSYSFVGGWRNNSTNGIDSYIGGGNSNTTSGGNGFVAGGSGNNAGLNSFAVGDSSTRFCTSTTTRATSIAVRPTRPICRSCSRFN